MFYIDPRCCPAAGKKARSGSVIRVGARACCKRGIGSARSNGYDGQVIGAPVGIDAAHVRWFSFDGPDTLDNGLALCVLHHKLFDLGALGLDAALRVQVSSMFTTRTEAGRAVYELHGRELRPRPGTVRPDPAHITWHVREVFKGNPLAA